MRALLSLSIVCILFSIISLIYLKLDKRNLSNRPPQQPEQPLPGPQPVNNLHQIEPEHQAETEGTVASEYEMNPRAEFGTDLPENTETQLQQEHYDWRDDASNNRLSKHKQKSDPWKHRDAVESRRARGTLITDPETMDPDALVDAIHNQLIERFGDIPQVHIFTEAKRKQFKKIPLTLDEMIARTEASLYLFPNPNARQYLKQLKQWKAEGYKITFKYGERE